MRCIATQWDAQNSLKNIGVSDVFFYPDSAGKNKRKREGGILWLRGQVISCPRGRVLDV